MEADERGWVRQVGERMNVTKRKGKWEEGKTEEVQAGAPTACLE